MIQSILDDIKAQFRYGNMISKIILVNAFVLLLITLIKALFNVPGTSFYSKFIGFIALHSDIAEWLIKPWTFLSHMFLHEGFWHFGWNMIMLYWFGRIVGDLIGDRKILPLYIIGGLAGAIFYIFWANIWGHTGIALGASGAVMCFVTTAAFVAPEYEMRLLLIGNVRLKYIALGIIIIDLMSNSGSNGGGVAAHLGGAAMGGLYVYLLRQGNDLTAPLQRTYEWMTTEKKSKKKKAPMKVVFNRKRDDTTYQRPPRRSNDTQEQIDHILDKINVSGYDSLTVEEKDFLYRASKD